MELNLIYRRGSINISLLTERNHVRQLALPHGRASDTSCFVINLFAMKPRLLFSIPILLVVLSFITAIPTGAQRSNQRQRTTQPAQRPSTSTRSPRDEALWQRALAIHRRAIFIHTPHHVTTPLTKYDYD